MDAECEYEFEQEAALIKSFLLKEELSHLSVKKKKAIRRTPAASSHDICRLALREYSKLNPSQGNHQPGGEEVERCQNTAKAS